MSNIDSKWALTVMDFVQNSYPERLSMVLLLHAPTAFWVLWKILKPFLAERTRNKFNFLGKDFATKLPDVMDPAHIPTNLGGKSTLTPQAWVQQELASADRTGAATGRAS
mmetsp:Transcript_13313/g.36798  ORF Transcript_13313/g.36798 Transcript_13313/m.36798 type:complete len:110 (+) Transcript_13313:600-929(+)